MSVRLNVYIGPYIECLNRKVEKKEPYHGCPACQREVWSRETKFCDKCGGPLGPCERTKIADAVEYGQIRQAFTEAGLGEDDLISVGSQEDRWLIPNKRDAPGEHFDPDSEFGLWLDPDDLDPEQEIDNLEAYCVIHLAILRKLHQPGEVFVRWGVLSYTS